MMYVQFQVGFYVNLCEVTFGSVVTATIFKTLMKFYTPAAVNKLQFSVYKKNC
jgi:hypothetical protein